VASASPHEVTLVEDTLGRSFTNELPERLIGDKAYDSEQARQQAGRGLGDKNDCPQPTKSAQDSRWAGIAALPPTLEGRTIFCLAAKLPPS